jgi:tetratricopeptide (TPR) repeat protein
LVLDPAREQVALTRSASVTVDELVKLLDDGAAAVQAVGESDVAVRALAEAERLSGAGKPVEAAAAYRRALDAGGPRWPRRARTVESLTLALSNANDLKGCAALAAAETPGWPRDALFVSVVTSGLVCAVEAPASEPWRAAALASLERLAREGLAVPGLLADDRSGVYEMLVDARDAAGDSAGVHQLAGEWLAFLEAEAARAPTPQARAAFDAHRLSAAIALGEPARALPPLLASERELPDDYNAPARLAIAYLELGRYDEALAASDRAAAKVYGPRRLRVEETRAKIYVKKGDAAAARDVIDRTLALAATLPPSERTRHTVERLRALREKLK